MCWLEHTNTIPACAEHPCLYELTAPKSNCSSEKPLHTGLQSSHWILCFYHQDLHATLPVCSKVSSLGYLTFVKISKILEHVLTNEHAVLFAENPNILSFWKMSSRRPPRLKWSDTISPSQSPEWCTIQLVQEVVPSQHQSLTIQHLKILRPLPRGMG